MPTPDAGGRAARSALLELITQWRERAEEFRRMREAGEAASAERCGAAEMWTRQCATELEAALEAAWLAAGVEHRVLQQAAGDPSLCRECLGCGSYVSARNIVEGRDPSVECESCHGTGLAAGDRPSLDEADELAMYRAYYGPSDDSLRSWWEHKLAVGTRAATRGPDEQ